MGEINFKNMGLVDLFKKYAFTLKDIQEIENEMKNLYEKEAGVLTEMGGGQGVVIGGSYYSHVKPLEDAKKYKEHIIESIINELSDRERMYSQK